MIRFTKTGYDLDNSGCRYFRLNAKDISENEDSICAVRDDISISEVMSILNLFQIKTKFETGNPRPLASIELDILRKYVDTHNPSDGFLLLCIAERISEIAADLRANGMSYCDMTSDVLIEPEVDSDMLNEFLQEFIPKGE